MTWFRWEGSDLILQLKIQPGAKRSEFAGLHGEYLKLRIHAPPLEGRANSALVEFLGECFAVSKANIVLEQGQFGRVKRVRLRAPTTIPDALMQLGLCAPR